MPLMTPAGKKWVEAGKALAIDSSARIRCPERDDGVLQVRDVPTPDGTMMERYMTCDTCGAQNVILMRAKRSYLEGSSAESARGPSGGS
jgi:hypothetical protein